MLYVIFVVLLVLLVGYILGRWLLREFREFSGTLAERIKIARGGKTPQRVLEEVRQDLAQRGLKADLVVVSRRIGPVYDALRRRIVGRRVQQSMPAALVFALAADVEHGMLYLRSVYGTVDESGREGRDCVAFDAVARIERVPARFDADIAPPAEEALEIVTTDTDQPPFHLPLEKAWGVSPRDLSDRIRRIVCHGERPAGGSVIVR